MTAAVEVGDALAEIGAALQIPVLIGALALLAACAFELGRFGVETWRRTGAPRGTLRTLVRQARANPAYAGHLMPRAPSAIAGRALVAIAAAGARSDAIEHALGDFELAVQRRLDRTRLLVRAGPALGLMGTLIPLAPGLEALGNGDVASLADELRTAFGATVVGLLVGTVAFALTLSRTRRWTEELAELERGAADPLGAAS